MNKQPPQIVIISNTLLFFHSVALFIAQQDPVLNQSRPELHQTKPEEKEEDKNFGHFCAPWVPGFCEANFCIFHNPIEDHSSRSEGNVIEHNKAGS